MGRLDETTSGELAGPTDSGPRPAKEWGPFGIGRWKGHPDVYCRVCGWPVYLVWVDTVPLPGDCPEGHTLARSCPSVLNTLMQNAFARAALGGTEPQPPLEMLRKVAGLEWDEIERMCDASGRGSHTIAEMRKSGTDLMITAYPSLPSIG